MIKYITIILITSFLIINSSLAEDNLPPLPDVLKESTAKSANENSSPSIFDKIKDFFWPPKKQTTDQETVKKIEITSERDKSAEPIKIIEPPELNPNIKNTQNISEIQSPLIEQKKVEGNEDLQKPAAAIPEINNNIANIKPENNPTAPKTSITDVDPSYVTNSQTESATSQKDSTDISIKDFDLDKFQDQVKAKEDNPSDAQPATSPSPDVNSSQIPPVIFEIQKPSTIDSKKDNPFSQPLQKSLQMPPVPPVQSQTLIAPTKPDADLSKQGPEPVLNQVPGQLPNALPNQLIGPNSNKINIFSPDSDKLRNENISNKEISPTIEKIQTLPVSQNPQASSKDSLAFPKLTPSQNLKQGELDSFKGKENIEIAKKPQLTDVASNPTSENTKESAIPKTNIQDPKSVHNTNSFTDKFIEDETIMLQLKDEDSGLGELTLQERYELLDANAYIKLFWQNFTTPEELKQKSRINKFIEDYKEDKFYGYSIFPYISKNLQDNPQIERPLHENDLRTETIKTIMNGDLDSLRVWVDNYPVLNICNEEGDNLLSISVLENNYEIVKYLIRRGINYRNKNYHGETALDLAIKNDYKDIIELLQKAESKSRNAIFKHSNN